MQKEFYAYLTHWHRAHPGYYGYNRHVLTAKVQKLTQWIEIGQSQGMNIPFDPVEPNDLFSKRFA